MNDGYVLGESAAARVRQILQDGLSAAPGPTAAPTGRQLAWLTVTAAKSSTGHYPCRIDVPSNGGNIEYPNAAECRDVDGLDLVDGNRYLGVRLGDSADGLARFAVLGKADWTHKTAGVEDAWKGGLVSADPQSWKGPKTFRDTLTQQIPAVSHSCELLTTADDAQVVVGAIGPGLAGGNSVRLVASPKTTETLTDGTEIASVHYTPFIEFARNIKGSGTTIVSGIGALGDLVVIQPGSLPNAGADQWGTLYGSAGLKAWTVRGSFRAGSPTGAFDSESVDVGSAGTITAYNVPTEDGHFAGGRYRIVRDRHPGADVAETPRPTLDGVDGDVQFTRRNFSTSTPTFEEMVLYVRGGIVVGTGPYTPPPPPPYSPPPYIPPSPPPVPPPPISPPPVGPPPPVGFVQAGFGANHAAVIGTGTLDGGTAPTPGTFVTLGSYTVNGAHTVVWTDPPAGNTGITWSVVGTTADDQSGTTATANLSLTDVESFTINFNATMPPPPPPPPGTCTYWALYDNTGINTGGSGCSNTAPPDTIHPGWYWVNTGICCICENGDPCS